MHPITNISTIIPNYDAILLDLWGVVHDGTHMYPGAHEAMTQLKAADKKIILVSNAPRRAKKAVAVLEQLGVDASLYDHIITSGELGWRWLAQLSSPSPLEGEGGVGGDTDSMSERDSPPLLTSPLKGGRNYYYIGPSKDADVLDGLDYRRVDDVKQADFLLNVGFGSEEEQASDFSMLLRAAKAQGTPMLCLNPDMEVVKITGERFACAGVIADEYARMGGEVKYFGKPFREVYEYCMMHLGTDKARVLAIGDGIFTDIKGAVDFGMDSVLVTGGIFKKDEHAVEDLCRKHGVVPGYVMAALVW